MAVALMAIAMVSCSKSKYKGYDVTESGLHYKFYTQNSDAQAPQIGDVLTLSLVYKTENDSIIEDSRKAPYPFMIILQDSKFGNDLYEGLAMMRLGDSASFVLKADSFYISTAGFPDAPSFVTPEMMFIFDIKIEEITPKAEFEAQMAEMQRMMEEEASKAKESEPELIKTYITENNIKVKPSATGLYYVEIQRGSGKKAQNGMMCKVNYKGYLFDGKVFDSSEGREPFEFRLGQDAVIQGWHEGIALMNVGGKAKLILPSSLAYGANGAGGMIPPYSPLVFEVELVDAE